MDLKQWQLSLATTTSGVPMGLQVLDGNASDRVTLVQQVAEVVYQLRADHEEEPIYVADSALYSEATMTDLNQKGIWWVSRVPETSLQAKALIARDAKQAAPKPPAQMLGVRGLHPPPTDRPARYFV